MFVMKYFIRKKVIFNNHFNQSKCVTFKSGNIVRSCYLVSNSKLLNVKRYLCIIITLYEKTFEAIYLESQPLVINFFCSLTYLSHDGY